MTEYEFSSEEDLIISRMASRMRVLGILLMLVGLGSLSLMYFTVYNFGSLLGGLLWFVMGLFFFLPFDNFKRITTSAEHDIAELLQGFRELNKGWTFILGLLLLHRGYLIYSYLI